MVNVSNDEGVGGSQRTGFWQLLHCTSAMVGRWGLAVRPDFKLYYLVTELHDCNCAKLCLLWSDRVTFNMMVFNIRYVFL